MRRIADHQPLVTSHGMFLMTMIWLFERQGEYLRYEARPCTDGRGYELVITYPNGAEIIERFDDSSALSKRQKELEGQLSEQGWNGPHGWFA